MLSVLVCSSFVFVCRKSVCLFVEVLCLCVGCLFVCVHSFCCSLQELFVEHFARQACNQATKEGRINVGYDDLGKCEMLASVLWCFFWGGGGSFLRADNWGIDLNEHSHSKINQSIARIYVR